MTGLRHDYVLDSGVFALLAAHFWGVLPHVTALAAFVLVVVRLYETKTGRAALVRLKQWLCD